MRKGRSGIMRRGGAAPAEPRKDGGPTAAAPAERRREGGSDRTARAEARQHAVAATGETAQARPDGGTAATAPAATAPAATLSPATGPAPAVPSAPGAAPGTVPVTHVEHHFTASERVRDVVIGMSDGLTVPFALAAGLSSAVAATRIVIVGGLAEIAAGSIAMGLGGFLAARTDAEHYLTERGREQAELVDHPDEEETEVVRIFGHHGVGPEVAGPVARQLRQRPSAWLDFVMRFELGLEKPDPRRATSSAATIALSYVAGGLVPLSPYFFLPRVAEALPVSVAVTLVALMVFGFAKGQYTGTNPLRSGLQTALVGGLAAGAAFGLARLIGG